MKAPKSFDAQALKDTLEKYVNGEKCDGGNVRPHDKPYLQPRKRPEDKTALLSVNA